jgi:hypothetical protein
MPDKSYSDQQRTWLVGEVTLLRNWWRLCNQLKTYWTVGSSARLKLRMCFWSPHSSYLFRRSYFSWFVVLISLLREEYKSWSPLLRTFNHLLPASLSLRLTALFEVSSQTFNQCSFLPDSKRASLELDYLFKGQVFYFVVLNITGKQRD